MIYRLHYAPDNASLVIRLALEEIGAPYETVLVDRSARVQKSLGYLALNPSGLIPVLETQSGAMFETGAILLWVADRHRQGAPAPDARDRGDFLKWLFYLANTVHPTLRMSFYPGQYLGHSAGDLCAAAQARFAEQLDILEARALPWFGPDRPSVLDPYLACLMRWRAIYPARAGAEYDPRRWPRLFALLARIEASAACRAAMAAEGLGQRPFTAPHYPDPPEGSAL